MSDAPTPHTVWPSRFGASFPTGGTVSRCPARTSRWSWPSAVRATTLSPTRVTSSHPQARSAASTSPASAASPLLGDGTAMRSRVAASRSTTGSGAGAVVPQDLVQLRLVVALPLAEALDHEDARHEELPARVLAPPAGPDRDAPRRHHAAGDLLAGLGIDDGDGGIEEAPRAQYRPLPDARPAGHHAATADEGIAPPAPGPRVGRLEHAADAHAARQVDALPDLGAGGDGGP